MTTVVNTMNANSEPHRRIRRQGPATLRGKQIPETTTDQRLLDRRGPSDWVHTDPWRVLRIQSEFIEGFGTLAELPPAISVFGSANRDLRNTTGPRCFSRGRSASPFTWGSAVTDRV